MRCTATKQVAPEVDSWTPRSLRLVKAVGSLRTSTANVLSTLSCKSKAAIGREQPN